MIALMSSVGSGHTSYDAPCVFGGMAEFAACHTSAEAVVAYADGLVFEAVREVVLPFCHCPNEDADALAGDERIEIVSDSDYFGVEAECDLSATWRKVVGDGILDDFQQLFLRIY